jgi:type II secretory pathway predicted ATPase ExeA
MDSGQRPETAAVDVPGSTAPPEGQASRPATRPPSDATTKEQTRSAEYRSRLSWFIGVSDAGPIDKSALTYEPFFGLREKPFSLASDPRFFCSEASRGAAFDTMATAIRRREGILVLTGEVGTGKTTLCRAVLRSLDQKTFAAFVPDPFLSREDLLKTLLVDFGVVSVDDIKSGRLRGASRTDLSYPLYDFLASLRPLKAFAVVMIDEAQNLATELLEEIRILSDLEDGQRLIEVVLVGQPELRARLAAPDMRQLRQRVSTRCDLAPLTHAEVEPYVSRRLLIAGNDGRLQFTGAAIDLVSTAAEGIPRVINLVCDRALLRAARAEVMTVSAEHVAGALDDLQLSGGAQAEAVAHGRTGRRSTPPPPAPTLAVQVDLSAPEFHDFPSESSPADSLSVGAVATTVQTRRAATVHGSPPGGRAQRAPAGVVPKSEVDRTFRQAGVWRRGLLAVAAGVLVVAAAGVLDWRVTSLGSHGTAGLQNSVPSTPQPSAPPTEVPKEPVPDLTPVTTPATAESPEQSTPPSASQASGDGHSAATHAIQIATFESAARAAQALQELRDAGFRAYTVAVQLRDGTAALAVFLGPYDERASADRDLDRVTKMPGYGGGWVVQAKSLPVPSSQP